MTGTRTIEGQLDDGILFEGNLQQAFTVRLPTVGDEIDVAEDEDIPDAGYRVALLARCLTSLGTVPAESITYELLRTLSSDDYRLILKAQEALKKKPSDSNKSTKDSAGPS